MINNTNKCQFLVSTNSSINKKMIFLGNYKELYLITTKKKRLEKYHTLEGVTPYVNIQKRRFPMNNLFKSQLIPTGQIYVRGIFVEHSRDIFPVYSEKVPYEIPGNIREY